MMSAAKSAAKSLKVVQNQSPTVPNADVAREEVVDNPSTAPNADWARVPNADWARGPNADVAREVMDCMAHVKTAGAFIRMAAMHMHARHRHARHARHTRGAQLPIIARSA